MDTAIYYFSGTGSPLAVARHLAAATGSIPAARAREHISPGADVVLLVFPVYHRPAVTLAGMLNQVSGRG